MRFVTVFTLLLLNSSLLSAAYKLVQAPLVDDPMQVHIYELENGLTVLLSENHEEPRFYSEIAVRVGGADDPDANTGLAHYLEHLLFKGNQVLGTTDWAAEKPHYDRIVELYEERFHETDEAKRTELYKQIDEESVIAAEYAIPNEVDRIVKGIGVGFVNASTGTDSTGYYYDFPSNRIEEWALLESNRFTDPVFRLFLTELEVVYEEKNRSMDDRGRLIMEEIFRLRYPDHPYGTRTVLGSVEHLKNPSIQAIHDYFDTYYVANNMSISLSGDFEIEEMIEVIDEHFSSWETGEVPEFKYGKSLSVGDERESTIYYPGQEQLYLSFATVPFGHEDYPVLQLIDMCMDNGVAGLININLNQRQTVLNASSFQYYRLHAGSQYFTGEPLEGQSLEEVEQLILDQIELLKAGDFDEALLDAIVNDYKQSDKLRLESNQSRAGKMSSSHRLRKGWAYSVGEIERLEKVTKADIVRVTNKYFKDYVKVYQRDEEFTPPKITKPEFTKTEIKGYESSEFGEMILSMEATPIEPEYIVEGEDYQIIELLDGVRLVYSKNPMNDLFRMSLVFNYGKREDQLLPLASIVMDKVGTESLSSEALKTKWYSLGSNFNFGVSDHKSSVSISGLDENLDETLAIMQQLITDPRCSPEVFAEVIEINQTNRENAKKDIKSLFLALRNLNRYGEQSPFLTRMSEAEMRALKVEDILSLVSEMKRYKHDYLYVGSLEIEDVASRIKQYYEADTVFKDTPELSFLKLREPEHNEVLFFDKESAQAQVRIEFPNGMYSEDDYLPIQLYNSYFSGGMSGIVFQELRETRALAYTAWAHFLQAGYPQDENFVIGNIGTQSDKAVDALGAFIELFNEMPKSEGRFQNTLASMENSFRTNKLSFRAIPATVLNWEKMGYEGDPRKARFEDLLSAEFGQLIDFEEERIAGRAKLISVLGPKERIGYEGLQEFGEFKEVSLEDLFRD